MDVPQIGPIFGAGAGLLWKSYETFAQISLRNQLLVGGFYWGDRGRGVGGEGI
jgi:hypothetical protein